VRRLQDVVSLRSADGPTTSQSDTIPFDLLIKGGVVLDPTAGHFARADVAVRGGLIERVEPAIDGSLAAEILDAEGCIVTPGLVDLHTHVFFSGTYWGIDPATVSWRTGVTSWVDAGSAGAYTLGALRHLLEGLRVPLSVRAFVNISAAGLVAETGEAVRAELCDADLCIGAIEDNRDFVVGVKVRIDRFAVGGNGLSPLRNAMHAADATGLPVMVHIGEGPPRIDGVLDLLRPGDIVTHCATGQNMCLLDSRGRIRPSAIAAHKRGVLFDLGHGSGSFSFEVAEAMLDQGLSPDTISSDLHQRSILGPGFDLPTCMSKYLALGMPLEGVMAATTIKPELAIAGGEAGAGCVAAGRRADIAIFDVEEGDFILYDSQLQRRRADRLLVNRATVLAGTVLKPMSPSKPARWVRTTKAQRSLLTRSALELRHPWAAVLTKPGDFMPNTFECEDVLRGDV